MANLVVHTDLNCLSVIHYAVEVLMVKHIIVCGHYGCGGVAAAMSNEQHGLVDNWLLHIKDIYKKNELALSVIENQQLRFKRLCEVNVIEQAYSVCHTTIVQNAWRRGQELTVPRLDLRSRRRSDTRSWYLRQQTGRGLGNLSKSRSILAHRCGFCASLRCGAVAVPR